MDKAKQIAAKILPIIRIASPAILVIYYEFLFKCSTSRVPHDINMLYIVLFASSLGLVISAIFQLVRGKAARIILPIISLVLSVPYLVEYFIYRQFKVFYDINTITNGSEGALTGFKDHITEMVFSWSGMLIIFLYLIPTILGIIMIVKSIDLMPVVPKYVAAILVGAALICHITAVGMINSNKIYKNAYKSEYSFEKSVSNYGLMTGLRQEVERKINPDKGTEFTENVVPSFTITSTPTPAYTPTPEPTLAPDCTPTPTPTPSPTPTPYQPQVIEGLDFEALAENSSGKIKDINLYVASCTPSLTNEYTGLFEGKNLIMITAEAFTAEVIDPDLTPTLYRMATKGINFTDHYVPATAGTTGGEFSHITGFLPVDGGSSMTHYVNDNAYLTMGFQLNRLGYYGIMYHNNDHQYYSRHITHNMLGYSDGFIGYGNGLEDYITNCWPESDLEMFMATVPTYIDKPQFNVYYMTVSGHSGYGKGYNAQSKKHWDDVADLECSDKIKAYLACNLELEYSMQYLIEQLEAAGIADDTVIVINADHFPYGLDNDAPLGSLPYLAELYGVDSITDYFTRDHNRLIIWSGCLEDSDPIIVDTPTTSLDILPTLCNLFGVEWDSRLLPGRDVFSDAFPVAYNLNYDWKTDLGTYYANKALFVPYDDTIEIPDEYVDQVRDYVYNKIAFMRNVMNNDYYGYLFDEDDDS